MKDRHTTVIELKERIKRFCEDREWDRYHNAKDLAIGISTEASELLEIFRFKSEKEAEEMFESERKKKEIGEEIADILFFLLRLAQKYDMDVAEQLERVVEKNEKRYPVEKARGSNKKYSELEL
jgi:NTP pyrophosphatase (non-canonical NTP hydrolase)